MSQIKEIDTQIAALLQKRRAIKSKSNPVTLVIEHDDTGTIYQAIVFGNTPKEKKAALTLAEEIVEDYYNSEEQEEQTLQEAKKTLRKKKTWTGYSNAVSIL